MDSEDAATVTTASDSTPETEDEPTPPLPSRPKHALDGKFRFGGLQVCIK